jgi:hypothetical protein
MGEGKGWGKKSMPNEHNKLPAQIAARALAPVQSGSTDLAPRRIRAAIVVDRKTFTSFDPVGFAIFATHARGARPVGFAIFATHARGARVGLRVTS